MIVFKTFLKVLKACKTPIIMYTVFLVVFGGLNMQTSDTATSFESTKPDILIINNDEDKGITKNLIDYIKDNSNIMDIKDTEEAINDALFYRDVNYIIYIPDNYREDFLNNQNPKIEIKSTGDYNASLAHMMLEKYVKVANTYNAKLDNEEEIISNINKTLSIKTEIELTSNLDTNNLARATFYYNFMNYSLLAGLVYVICLILSSFNEIKVKKRTIISSMKTSAHNKNLLLSNGLFAIILWIFYVVLGFILLGDIMFTTHGIIYIINSFIFMICSLTIAFLIATLVNNKNAINGIVNVVALGTSFLCGAFVPMEWLPSSVINIAHVLPSYWYIKTNELLKTIEVFNFETLKPIFINMIVILLFTILFIVITNIVSKKKRKIS